MKRIIRNGTVLLAVVLSVVATSCVSNAWDEHFSNTNISLSDQSLTDLISADTDLSTFYQMLQVTGYDTILSKDQTYTVWAPKNEAFADIEFYDEESIKEIVTNHIARFSHTTSGIDTKRVYMLSGKLVDFADTGTNFTFGTKSLIKKDISALNGIIHEIDGYVPYTPNIWESLERNPDLDSVFAYLDSQSKLAFDASLSTEVGRTASNQPIYDSVFVFSNQYMDDFGALDDEDSTYTALFPNNDAWNRSYELIKDYYNNIETKFSQEEQTKRAIIQDAIFRGLHTAPATENPLVSTNGNSFTNASELFRNASPQSVSNGIVFTTDSMSFKATDSWHKEIRIEAENTDYGREFMNSNIYSRTSSGTGFSISDDSYIFVEPTTTSSVSKVWVKFSVPNTLSAKYNLYCVFVPEAIEKASSTKPYRANFYMDTYGPTGTKITKQTLATALETNASTVTKMFVKQVTFPYCNLWDDEKSTNTDIVVKIWVENAVKNTETTKYSRTMRIDCIILEPVE